MSPSATLGVGVIGNGFGRGVAAPVFDETDGCRVVDVVSARDEDAVRALCRRPDVDLVSVHSPPFLHARDVGLALDAGHAVLCDKPFGRNAAEAATMEAAARDAGAVALVNYEFRHHPTRAALLSLLRDGTIGDVEHVVWTQYGSAFRRRRPNWVFDAELGGGWIGAWGSHIVDFVRWTLGEIVDAGASLRTTVVDRVDREGNVRPSTAEDGFTAWMRTDGGATVALDSTLVAKVTLGGRLLVLGSEGALEVVADEHITLTAAEGSREIFRWDAEGRDPHLAPMRAWAEVVRDAVRSGTVPEGEPTFADGVACARVMDVLRASALSA
jgi:predicted dehydrogenase